MNLFLVVVFAPEFYSEVHFDSGALLFDFSMQQSTENKQNLKLVYRDQ